MHKGERSRASRSASARRQARAGSAGDPHLCIHANAFPLAYGTDGTTVPLAVSSESAHRLVRSLWLWPAPLAWPALRPTLMFTESASACAANGRA